MCYFLYGAVNEEIRERDAESNACWGEYRFAPGTKSQLKACIEAGGQDFRLTDRHCDCGTAIGSGRGRENELRELAARIGGMRKLRGIKCIYLSKNWIGNGTKTEKTVHVEDVSLIPFLAELEESCLYRIDLYPRY